MSDMSGIDWNAVEGVGTADGAGQAASTYGLDGSGGFYDFGQSIDYSTVTTVDGGFPSAGIPEPPVLVPDTSIYEIPTSITAPSGPTNLEAPPDLYMGGPNYATEDPFGLETPPSAYDSAMSGAAHAGPIYSGSNGRGGAQNYLPPVSLNMGSSIPSNPRGYQTVNTNLPKPLPGQTLRTAPTPGVLGGLLGTSSSVGTGMLALVGIGLLLIFLARR